MEHKRVPMCSFFNQRFVNIVKVFEIIFDTIFVIILVLFTLQVRVLR